MSMRRCGLVLIILFAAIACLAAKQESLQEMIARANAAPMKDQPSLYINIAEHQLRSADQLYSAGKVDEARSAVGDVVTYSEKAHDAAIQSGKKLKPTEMAARKMGHRLQDIKRTLNFEDQAPVQAAAERLVSIAQDLLNHMFEK